MARTTGTSRIVRVDRAERIGTSRMGNPSYTVYFTDGTSARTQSDAGCAYGINNSEYRERDHMAHFTKAGRLAWLERI